MGPWSCMLLPAASGSSTWCHSLIQVHDLHQAYHTLCIALFPDEKTDFYSVMLFTVLHSRVDSIRVLPLRLTVFQSGGASLQGTNESPERLHMEANCIFTNIQNILCA